MNKILTYRLKYKIDKDMLRKRITDEVLKKYVRLSGRKSIEVYPIFVHDEIGRLIAEHDRYEYKIMYETIDEETNEDFVRQIIESNVNFGEWLKDEYTNEPTM